MTCVASYLSSDEDPIVPQVIQAILSTQTVQVHTALKYTGIRLLGQLDQWIDKHQQDVLSEILSLRPDWNKMKIRLESVLRYLLSLLIDKDLRQISAETILSICQTCRKHLVTDLEQILQATLWLDQTEAGSEAAQCLLEK